MHKNEKIRLGEKTAFFLANMGNIPIMSLISAFLLIFYTDVVGLKPAAVGTLFLLTKLFDGVNDPIMGFLIDRIPRGKNGKFKTLLFIGAIVCSVNFLLVWYGPALAPAALKLAVAYISYVLLGITFDLMDISLNCMIPAMTSDLKQRNTLSSIKGAGYMLGTVIVSVGAPLLIDAYNKSVTGYLILIAVTSAVVLAFSTIGAIGVKERVSAINDEKYSLKQLLSFLMVGPVFVTFISQLFFITGKSVLTAAEVFYATYIIGDLKIMSILSAIMLVGMIPAVALSGALVKRFGKKLVYGVGIILFGAGLLLRLFGVENTLLIYIAYVIVGFGAGSVMVLMYGIQADNIDYVEYVKGSRAEGAISSLQSLVAKVGGALGGAIPAYILAWTGYVKNVEQTAGAKTGIIVATIVVPVVFCLIAALTFLFVYKLDSKKLEETVNALEKLRKEKQQSL